MHFGPLDSMFDFDHDGELDPAEMAAEFSFLEEMEEEDDEDNDDEDDDEDEYDDYDD